MQMAELGYMPVSDVLAELGYEDPNAMQAQAAKEMAQRQQLGLPPPQPQGQKKGKK